jgi:ERO1-like protein alpha
LQGLIETGSGFVLDFEMVKFTKSFKPKQENKKERRKWSSWWLIGASLAVVLAVIAAGTVSPMNASKIGSLISSNYKSCLCSSAQVRFHFF